MTLNNDGYTFVLSDEVTRTPVRYQNRYGIEIAGDLYQRKGLDESATYPALVIGPPHGGVKELVVVPGARHIDLYDRTELIPFDQLEKFFSDNLA
jgi:fermentation-respiration switch protein FrsA (DUF1100 family)